MARYWSARASRDAAPQDALHFNEHVLPALQTIDGYAGATLLLRDADADADDAVEVVVMTRWRSLDAIRAFAGDDLETAVVAAAAAALFTDDDRRVKHFDVVAKDGQS